MLQAAAKATQEQLGPKTKHRIEQNKKVESAERKLTTSKAYASKHSFKNSVDLSGVWVRVRPTTARSLSDYFGKLSSPRTPGTTPTDDGGATIPVLRGGEDASCSAGAHVVKHSPAGPSRIREASSGGAGPPQSPATEDYPKHAPKGILACHSCCHVRAQR